MSKRRDRPPAAPGIVESFDAVVLPHLDAAYRLARWLLQDEHAWFLRIVRNTSNSWRQHGVQAPTDSFDEKRHSSARPQSDPEALLLQTADAATIARAMSSLPDRCHQLLVLREIEGLSYRELADVVGIPVGTVMSRLPRAREALRGTLDHEFKQPAISSTPRCREQEADAVLV